jgi:hypothetical protein
LIDFIRNKIDDISNKIPKIEELLVKDMLKYDIILLKELVYHFPETAKMLPENTFDPK